MKFKSPPSQNKQPFQLKWGLIIMCFPKLHHKGMYDYGSASGAIKLFEMRILISQPAMILSREYETQIYLITK